MFEKEATKLQSESICLEVRMSKSIVSETAQKNGQETRVATLEPPSGGGNMLRVGVIGYGYWGPNIVRNLHSQKSCQAVMVCDSNPAALSRVRKTYPGVEPVPDPMEFLRSPSSDALSLI